MKLRKEEKRKKEREMKMRWKERFCDLGGGRRKKEEGRVDSQRDGLRSNSGGTIGEI